MSSQGAVVRSEQLMEGQPVVELRNVARRFIKRRERSRSFQDKFIRMLSRRNVEQEEFWPLRDISLAIQPGEALGVIGPNGSGKSTLLKLITGILPPTGGAMAVRGRVCSLLELGAGFHPDLTGRENIFLNGSIYGLNRRQMNARVDRIVDFAELGDFIDTPVRHYSSGMYVRLGFAVAIHTDPDLLLVDEVLAVGDATFQHKCLSAIQRFRDNGGTLLLVSHDLESIQSICRRAIWIEDGHIQAEGNPTDVVMAYIGHLVAREEAVRGDGNPNIAADDPPGAAWVARRRWGTGKVRVTRVALLDAEAKPCTTFRNGDLLTIRIYYQASERVNHPVFGLAIYHQNGGLVAGPNSQFGGLDIHYVEGDGWIDYTIAELPLIEADYNISIAAVSHDDSETYDYHDRLYTFRVYPGRTLERYGMVTLTGEWQHPAEPESSAAEQHHLQTDR